MNEQFTPEEQAWLDECVKPETPYTLKVLQRRVGVFSKREDKLIFGFIDDVDIFLYRLLITLGFSTVKGDG